MIAKTKKVKYNQSKVCKENINWGSHINPIGTLRDGEIYEIEREEVHTWHTKIFLKGVNGSCNSVWFDKITEDTHYCLLRSRKNMDIDSCPDLEDKTAYENPTKSKEIG